MRLPDGPAPSHIQLVGRYWWAAVIGIVANVGSLVSSIVYAPWPLWASGYFLVGGLLLAQGLAIQYLLRRERSSATIERLANLYEVGQTFLAGSPDEPRVKQWARSIASLLTPDRRAIFNSDVGLEAQLDAVDDSEWKRFVRARLLRLESIMAALRQ